jgi:hypothetical protein
MNVSQFKINFFDKKAVTDKVDATERRLLSRVGAFVRRKAKSSLKYGKGTSSPGQPPVVHRSIGFTRTKTDKHGVTKKQLLSPLRELMFFAYDSASNSVVIGPAIWNHDTGIPAALEWGGSSIAVHNGRQVTITIGARPTVTPALETEAPKAIATLKDSL